MSVNASSTNIQIFPTAGRPIYDPLGRLTTEYNLTSILNKLLDVDGFVITPNPYEESNNSLIPLLKPNGDPRDGTETTTKIPFEFNIKGYIVHLDNLVPVVQKVLTDTTTPITKIYANIQVQIYTASDNNNTQNSQYNHQRLDYLDGMDDASTSESEYSGVNFSSTSGEKSENSSILKYSLQILELRNDGWYVPDDSRIKFLTSKSGSRRSVSIDDGELT